LNGESDQMRVGWGSMEVSNWSCSTKLGICRWRSGINGLVLRRPVRAPGWAAKQC